MLSNRNIFFPSCTKMICLMTLVMSTSHEAKWETKQLTRNINWSYLAGPGSRRCVLSVTFGWWWAPVWWPGVDPGGADEARLGEAPSMTKEAVPPPRALLLLPPPPPPSFVEAVATGTKLGRCGRPRCELECVELEFQWLLIRGVYN